VSWPRDLRYRLEAGAARGLLAGAAVIPPRCLIPFARAIGWLAFRLWRKRREIAVANLRAAGLAPDAATARALALESFRTFCLMVVETLVLRQKLTPENWQQFVTLQASEEIQALLARRDQGLILASAHIGNWEIAARAGSMIRPMVYVHRPLKNPHLQRITYGGRVGANLRLVSSLDRAPFRFLEMLARGDVLGLMVDQHAGRQGVQVQFFGRPAWTTQSVAMLHLLTRVPLIAAFAIRTGPLRYEVHFAGPVRADRTGNRDQDARDLTQALTREVEKIVRQYPTQYMWGHRRWKP
jgi:KDO2-lipid IV(A) lauroyltransferase